MGKVLRGRWRCWRRRPPGRECLDGGPCASTSPPPRGGCRPAGGMFVESVCRENGKGGGGSTAERHRECLRFTVREMACQPLAFGPCGACREGHPQYSSRRGPWRQACTVHAPTIHDRATPLSEGGISCRHPWHFPAAARTRKMEGEAHGASSGSGRAARAERREERHSRWVGERAPWGRTSARRRQRRAWSSLPARRKSSPESTHAGAKSGA